MDIKRAMGKRIGTSRIPAALLASLLLFLLGGCSGIKVGSDYNHEFDFGHLKTFAWLPREEDPLRDPLSEAGARDVRVREAVETEMLAKGYLKRDTRPDFLITYHFSNQGRVDVEECGYHFPANPGCWNRDVETYTYSKPALVLDVMEPVGLELIWRGYASGYEYNQANMGETIDQAVRKVLDTFPPVSQP
jgi:hypothetical protein